MPLRLGKMDCNRHIPAQICVVLLHIEHHRIHDVTVTILTEGLLQSGASNIPDRARIEAHVDLFLQAVCT